MRDEIEALAASADAPDRARRIEALAAIPEQTVGFLCERLEQGVPDREPMLEVLARRHYREYSLHDVRSLDRGPDAPRPAVVASYSLDERPTRLVSSIGSVAELTEGSELVTSVASYVADRAAREDAVVDLYLSWPDAPSSA